VSTADTPASGKDSRAGSSRPLTAAEKQLAKQASEALRKLNAVNLGEASKIQKQLADIVKVSALPPGFIENLNRSVVPKFSARLLDTPSFKLASANLLKGFDFGGVTAAADLVAKANFGWNSQLQAVTSQLAKQHSAWLKSLVKLDFRLPYPPNLEGIEDLRLAEIEQVILVEGIPLYGIPRKAIAEALIRAESPEKRREILGRRWKAISADCRTHVNECTTAQTEALKRFSILALDALDAGHTEAAQALAANTLDTLLTTHMPIQRKKLVPGKKVTTSDHYRELAVREWLAFGPIWSAHQNYWPSNGDPVPRTFNRHVTVHGVSTSQFSKRNAIQGLMLVCSILRYADDRYAQMG
jgi:hypothetical protein